MPHTNPNYCRQHKRSSVLAKSIRPHYSDNSLPGFNVVAEQAILTNFIWGTERTDSRLKSKLCSHLETFYRVFLQGWGQQVLLHLQTEYVLTILDQWILCAGACWRRSCSAWRGYTPSKEAEVDDCHWQRKDAIHIILKQRLLNFLK